jgi:D-3-phosphoglycerate dehydrogenase
MEALVKLKQNPEFNVDTYSEDKLKFANALIIRSKFKITKELLDKTPALDAIVTCTSGYDHIDLDETKKRGICVMYTPEANVVSTSELTWGLILAAARKIPQAQKEMKAGVWNRDLFISNELSGKTLGVVGLGRVGSRVAKIAHAFEMKVLAFDPYQTDENFKNAGAECRS